MKKIVFPILFLFGFYVHVGAQGQSVIWEMFKYSGPGLSQIGWISPKNVKEIGENSPSEFPFWSIGCETLDRNYADFDKYRSYVGELGIKRARIQSGWAKTEKKKGQYDFEWLDKIVYGLLEEGVRPWISISYGNPIYGSEYRLGAKIFTDQPTIDAWLKYTAVLVERYKDVVKEWEVWNEPNLRNGGFAEYGHLLVNTADVIKMVDSEAKVIGFATSMIPFDFINEVMKILQKNNKLHLIDYLTYHPYTENPDFCYPLVDSLRLLVDKYNPDIKLFQGETGAPAILEHGHALNYYPWTEISQAKWRVRRMAGDRVRDIPSSIFTMIDLKYPNMLQSFGLLRANLLNEVIYKRPSFYAVQHMTSFFDGSEKSMGELNYQLRTQRKLRSKMNRPISVGGFEKNGKYASIIWYNDEIPSDEFSWDLVNLNIKGITFEDPVYVEMISGKVFEINETDWENDGSDVNFRNLPIWDSVIMIAERSEVKLK